MRWLVTCLFLAGISVGSATARADWGTGPMEPPAPFAPTTPQVPVPQVESGRLPDSPPHGVSAQVPDTSSCPDRGCAGKTSCAKKLLAWLSYHPTAGNALPKLKVHPYIGPYVGTFACSSAPGSSCGGKKECGATPVSAPGTPNMGKEAVEPAPVAILPRPVQGYPGRGCQGGSSQTVPMSQIPEGSISVEEVEFRPAGATINSDATGLSGEFIGAVLVARQVMTPMDALTRHNTQP
jgi:hypothetical protein